MKLLFKLLVFSLLFYSCQKDEEINSDKNKSDENEIISEIDSSGILDYLYLGHPYQSNSKVDKRLEEMDLSKFSQIWLGGDVCSETTQTQSTLTYLDNLFDLSNPGNFWSLGNQDIRNGIRNGFLKKRKEDHFIRLI